MMMMMMRNVYRSSVARLARGEAEKSRGATSGSRWANEFKSQPRGSRDVVNDQFSTQVGQ